MKRLNGFTLIELIVTMAIAAIVLTAKFRLADTGAGVTAELNAIAAAAAIGGMIPIAAKGTRQRL